MTKWTKEEIVSLVGFRRSGYDDFARDVGDILIRLSKFKENSFAVTISYAYGEKYPTSRTVQFNGDGEYDEAFYATKYFTALKDWMEIVRNLLNGMTNDMEIFTREVRESKDIFLDYLLNKRVEL